jgi:hypothetical protein
VAEVGVVKATQVQQCRMMESRRTCCSENGESIVWVHITVILDATETSFCLPASRYGQTTDDQSLCLMPFYIQSHGLRTNVAEMLKSPDHADVELGRPLRERRFEAVGEVNELNGDLREVAEAG